MDSWTHPRHAADGNAVSHDRLVGPPRRVRWVVGAPREDSHLVTSAGRNFYGEALARDGFNGLRLWQRPLEPGGRFAAPVAAGELLFAVSEKKLVAVDAATGKTLREYPEAGTPGDLLHLEGTLVAVDGGSVRALDAGTGRLRWKHEAPGPRYAVAGDGAMYFLQGAARRGEKVAAVCLDLARGNVRWRRDDYPWAEKVRRCVYHGGLLVFEISTLRDDKEGNMIHVVAAADGSPLWDRTFVPGMNHAKQARAMFIGDALWILEHRKCTALDPRTGEPERTLDAGFCHCFPPVGTPRFMLAGEMELTDLESGTLDANRITKAACGRDAGWVPANGLINVCPKHCVCWPMLRGFAAMAPARPGASHPKNVEEIDFLLEKGPAYTPIQNPKSKIQNSPDWPCYRHDAWRSGSTPQEVPVPTKTLWTAELGGLPEGPIADDWRDNPFVHGPVTAPVVAGGRVYVARPDAHQVVALDAGTGAVCWRFTAAGRVDTPPTIHRGLCLFGSGSGWVHCLRADDGRPVWRLRAAPSEERIVAYGQVESPWPVPGSVLVVDGVAYFAAGRQPLADGGILVFAVEPASGKIRWVKRLDSLPTKNFYACCALEFDNFDLLSREGDCVAMSRWLFDRATGEMTCREKEAFALLKMGGPGVIVPRGCWTYAPRHQPRHPGDRSPVRPLAVFRAGTLLGCLHDLRTVYRRDFDPAGAEKLDRSWITGWAAGTNFRKKEGEVWRSQRLAKEAKWSVPVFGDDAAGQKVAAMVLAADTLFLAGSDGGLKALSASDGKPLGRAEVPAPVWDGMAAADGRLFISTRDGRVVCLGKE